jgi:AraC family transcriptional regulator of adaptative response/methylated-DNA-[protein]-cysteine methyltransferase
MRSMTATSRYRAVLLRDRRADGSFVYAVRSTGIYCRPSCPSRKPRRERTTFFSTGAEAERAGFRPCRRCRPDATDAPSLVERIVRAWAELAAGNEDGRVPLRALAAAVGSSPSHVQRTFQRVLGCSPRELSNGQRLDTLRRALKEKKSVTEAIYEAGFGSSSRVYEQSSRRLGMTPAQYARGGAGETVRYATAASAVGRVLVAATERGVCAVKLGASDKELVSLLRDEFPRATIDAGDASMRGWVSDVLAMIDGTPTGAAVPLDISGTAFQLRVWKELQKIPQGETRSYAEIARRIGRPKAFRAVANACGANPACIVIPCHRVVAANGSLGGYHWGTERKQALLERERG